MDKARGITQDLPHPVTVLELLVKLADLSHQANNLDSQALLILKVNQEQE